MSLLWTGRQENGRPRAAWFRVHVRLALAPGATTLHDAGPKTRGTFILGSRPLGSQQGASRGELRPTPTAFHPPGPPGTQHAHTHEHTHMHTHRRTHMCAHMHTHAHTHVCAHPHAHTHAHMHTRTHERARTCTHTNTHMHTCTHRRAHVCTHAHTCTHRRAHTHVRHRPRAPARVIREMHHGKAQDAYFLRPPGRGREPYRSL